VTTHKNKWHELILVHLSIYPAGLTVREYTLDNGNIPVDGSWEDYLSDADLDKPVDASTEVTLEREYASLSMTFLHEGFGDSFIQYEYGAIGHDCFSDDDLKRVAADGRALRDSIAEADKKGSTDYYLDSSSSHVSFLTLWNIDYSYSGPNYWGEDDGYDADIRYVKIVRLIDIIQPLTELKGN
jgi:hypothetical protein